MYGKIFDSIYTGTLYGHWEAIVTFQQMIVLCDADGIVDMTPQGICGRTSIPIEIIQKGIAVLSESDPYTRTPGNDGKRIELIDAHRPWGWRIINHSKYKKLQDYDMVRAQTAERVRKHRELKRGVTDGNGQKRHTDTDTNAVKHKVDFIDLEFEKFWKAYPKRNGSNPKKPAKSIFASAVKKGADPTSIIRGAEQYANQCSREVTDKRFVPQAKTWLNQERWDDTPKPNDQFRGTI